MFIAMETNVLALSGALGTDSTARGQSPASDGFAQALGKAQSGAPPGNQPPATGEKVVEEVAKPGPNAQSQKPDLPPAADQDQSNQGSQSTEGASKKPTVSSAAALLTAFLGGAAMLPTIAQDPRSLTQETGSSGAGTASVQTQPVVANSVASPQDAIDLSASLSLVGTSPEGKAVAGDIPTSSSALAQADQTTKSVQEIAAEANRSAATQMATKDSAVNAVLVSQAAAKAESEPTITISQIVQQTPGAATPVQVAAAATSQVKISAPAQNSKAAAKAMDATELASEQDSAPTADAIGKAQSVAVMAKSDSSEPETSTDSGPKGVDPQGLAIQAKADTSPSTAPVSEPASGLRPGEINLVVKQIADKMQLLAATQQKDGITIQLQPDNLGSISMTVKSMAGTVQAHIAASNDSVRSALEENRNLLGQAMAEKGLKLEAVSIAAQTQTSTSAQRQSAQQQQAQGQSGQSSTQVSNRSQTTITGATHQARMTVRKVDGVDLWI